LNVLRKKKDLKSRQEVFDTEKELKAYQLMKEMLLFKIDFLLSIQSSFLTNAQLNNYCTIIKLLVSYHSLSYNVGIFSSIPQEGHSLKLDIYTKIPGRNGQDNEFIFPVLLSNKEFSQIHMQNMPEVSRAEFYNWLRFKNNFSLLNFFNSEIELFKVIPSLIETAYSFYLNNREKKDYLFDHCAHLSNYFVGQG
jgi:hypothetical protein